MIEKSSDPGGIYADGQLAKREGKGGGSVPKASNGSTLKQGWEGGGAWGWVTSFYSRLMGQKDDTAGELKGCKEPGPVRKGRLSKLPEKERGSRRAKTQGGMLHRFQRGKREKLGKLEGPP